MSSRMPPIPPGNRSDKEPAEEPHKNQSPSIQHPKPQNTAEQGETANIKQNTTNKGFFQGRRVK
jgi:hypothetical protein